MSSTYLIPLPFSIAARYVVFRRGGINFFERGSPPTLAELPLLVGCILLRLNAVKHTEVSTEASLTLACNTSHYSGNPLSDIANLRHEIHCHLHFFRT